MSIKAVVFDLDYTLWPSWCDTHIFPPIHPISKYEIKDSSNTKLSFYRDVEKIFEYLIERGILIIAASRTSAPEIALELLRNLYVLDKPAIEHFHDIQFGVGSKISHIQRAVKTLNGKGHGLETHQLVLFDDEMRNKDVETIGVLFKYVRQGINLDLVLEVFN